MAWHLFPQNVKNSRVKQWEHFIKNNISTVLLSEFHLWPELNAICFRIQSDGSEQIHNQLINNSGLEWFVENRIKRLSRLSLCLTRSIGMANLWKSWCLTNGKLAKDVECTVLVLRPFRPPSKTRDSKVPCEHWKTHTWAPYWATFSSRVFTLKQIRSLFVCLNELCTFIQLD